MSSSSLGIILLEKREGGQRVVKLCSIWHWKLQLQGETGTGATLRPRGATAAKTAPPSSLSAGKARQRRMKVERRKMIFSHGDVMCALRNVQHKKVKRCKQSIVITSDYDHEGNVTRVMTHTTGQSHAAQPGLRTVFSIVSTQMMFSQWRTFSTRPPWPLSALSQICG